mmetsp:Transcript_47468/g.103184  ORF Transcript_47468/g.103184 Transcript_47468/m.103184 type:complete len:227 (+) Transcript_47468:375-1055(+)
MPWLLVGVLLWQVAVSLESALALAPAPEDERPAGTPWLPWTASLELLLPSAEAALATAPPGSLDVGAAAAVGAAAGVGTADGVGAAAAVGEAAAAEGLQLEGLLVALAEGTLALCGVGEQERARAEDREGIGRSSEDEPPDCGGVLALSGAEALLPIFGDAPPCECQPKSPSSSSVRWHVQLWPQWHTPRWWNVWQVQFSAWHLWKGTALCSTLLCPQAQRAPGGT